MFQLASSLRVARASLKRPHPLIRPNQAHHAYLRQDAAVSNIVHHQPTVSSRGVVSAAASSSSYDMMGRYGLLDSNNLQPPFNSWTVQNSTMSTFTSIVESNRNASKNNKSTRDSRAKKVEADGNIPFRRSKRGGQGGGAASQGQKSNPKNASSGGFDDRAQAKITALSTAKQEAQDAKKEYLASTRAGGDANIETNSSELLNKWNVSEQTLALAYSQAIKYTSRMNNNPNATKTAELLLFGWMDRFVHPFGGSLVWANDGKGSSERDHEAMYMKKKKMIRSINEIVPILTSSDDSSIESNPSQSTAPLEEEDSASAALPLVRIPPPSSKDYINLLRAYSMSKARRKGQHCEALIANMMEMSKSVAHYYNEDDEKRTGEWDYDAGMESVVDREGNETKRWKLWVNESVPNSKAFALAIKCHAGSTHNESLERIIQLNYIHDNITECSQSHIPGMYVDDPYVLFHSIKSLKNLKMKEERDMGQKWLDKLHNFVTSPENMDYFLEAEKTSELDRATNQSEGSDQTESPAPLEAPAIQFQTINVTSAYTTMIRLMSRLRGAKDIAADAQKILDRMHEVQDISVNGFKKSESQTSLTDKDPDAPTNRKKIAFVEIKSNAYDLVLGLYRYSKQSEDATKAVELLQHMVDEGSAAPQDGSGVPLPTEQSFDFAITSLANMSDGEKAIQEAERLIQLMQDQDYLEPSATAYNSYITVCNKQLYGKPQLYDKVLDILDKMNELSKTNPGASPTPETLALVMKACSLSENEDHERVLVSATTLFSQLKEQEPDEKSALSLSDRAYYYMMKCVDTHMVGDKDTKKERIEELFSEACQRGLCSANILTMFRNRLSEDEFRLTVGKGRLADHWIANVKGPKALYTDGSSGGADKHARRKGKSTSDWTKKKNAKDSQRNARNNDKKAKKFFKKMKIAA